MNNVVRNVNKNQVMAQDIALGVGQVTQTRGGVQVTGDRVDIPVPVSSLAEISAYDPQVSTRLMFEIAPDNYLYYIYRENETEGVPSNVAPGVWVPQNIKSDIVLGLITGTTALVDGSNHNEFLTVTDPAGCVITIGRAEADLGYGLVPFVPSLIFINSATNGQVIIQGDTGVTVLSPATAQLAANGSTVGLIAIDVDKWVLMGDIKVV